MLSQDASRRLLKIASLAVATAIVAGIVGAPIALQAQQGSQSPSPSPGGGITNGSNAIETTLFAYRALASDIEAVSSEIASVAVGKKVVIGTASDIAAFTQWRAIMGEMLVLDRRAQDILYDLQQPSVANFNPRIPLPPAQLSITKTPSIPLTQGKPGSFSLIVSNGAAPGAGPTSGVVTVTDVLPKGLTLSKSGISGGGWTCDPNSVSCTRQDVLAAGASWPAITVQVEVDKDAPSSMTNSATVSGGGSAVYTVSLASPVRPASAVARKNFASTAAGTGTTTTTATPPASPASALSAATGAIPTLISLGQFLASAFSVTQTLSGSQGTMSDLPVMNMVARQLEHDRIRVYIPSIYVPNLLRNGTLEDTYLWRELYALETKRIQLWSAVAQATANLSLANYVVQNFTKYSTNDLNDSLVYAGKVQSLVSAATSLATTIDSFEASLFGGPAPASQQQSPAQQSPSQQSSSSPASGSTGSSPSSSSNPSSNTPSPSTQQSSSPSGNSPSGNSPSGSSPSGSGGQTGNILPQILASDLLAHSLWRDDNAWEPISIDVAYFQKKLDSVNFLAVHALESGGSQLNKSNIFYGTHIFFSGGAVLTFSLYQVAGDVACSGFAYNYEGNVREKHYDRALRLPQLPAILNTDFSCSGRTPSDSVSIRVGMTAEQVLRVMGVPYRVAAVKGNNYTYEYEDPDRTRVVFRNGAVVKVIGARPINEK